MDENLIQLNGEEIPYTDLTCEKAVLFSDAVYNSAFCRIIAIKKFESSEIVIFETDVECPQYPKNDIRKIEPLAVYFDMNDASAPSVYSLRRDFPNLPHTISNDHDDLTWLCIYEDSYEELKLEWTAIKFLENIRKWLALSAKDKLHEEDQPLEPFLLTSTEYIVIDNEIIESIDENNPQPLRVIAREFGTKTTYIVSNAISKNELKFALLRLKGNPVVHGFINRRPKVLSDLHTLLQKAGIDLIEQLRETLPKWKFSQDLTGILDASMILLIEIPLKRNAQSEIERLHRFVFIIKHKIHDIGKGIGIWDFHEGLVVEMVPINMELNGESLTLELLNPIGAFVSESARVYSGVKANEVKKISAIGLGAVGSQVFMNLLRMGFDSWNLIDSDILLPHNLGRHALFGFNVGLLKSHSLQQLGHNLINSDKIKSYPCDVLNEDSQGIALQEALKLVYKESEVILDMSASIPVSRYVSLNIDSPARRISVFLNPKGNDGIMLAEDVARKYRLDYLEMVYYRFLVETH